MLGSDGFAWYILTSFFFDVSIKGSFGLIEKQPKMHFALTGMRETRFSQPHMTAFAAFRAGAMGVGMAVQCIVGYGYGCDYGFGGLKSLIALVLALRARTRVREARLRRRHFRWIFGHS